MVRVQPYLRMVEAIERYRRLLDTIDVMIKECKKLAEERAKIQAENAKLAEERAKIQAENAILTKENAELRKKIAIMQGILAENKARVAKRKNAELRKKIASMKGNDEGLITVKDAAIGLLSVLAFEITINRLNWR